MLNPLKVLREQLFAIDDSPQKIALGVGLGVFVGVLPAMGPLIAGFFAVLFRVNRAAALIGGFLSNIWLGVPVFLAAVAIGSAITGISYDMIAAAWKALAKNFSWSAFSDFSLKDILIPVITGYLLISLILAVFSYIVTLLIIYRTKRAKPSSRL